jgi:hypothetical protein
MNEPDRYETQIYYVEALKLFHTVDYRATPSAKSLVVVRRLDDGRIAIGPFRGRPFIGVVRPLHDYFARPARCAQQRGRIEASAQKRMLDVGPAAEAPPKKKKPPKERTPFPRVLAC